MNSHDTEHNLMDPRNGYIAEHIRGKQGASETTEIAQLRAEVDELKRTLTLFVRAFRGIRLENQNIEIIPGPDGWLMLSTDDYLQFERDPFGGLHHGKLSLDIDATRAGILNETTLNTICDWCTSATPTPWPL